MYASSGSGTLGTRNAVDRNEPKIRMAIKIIVLVLVNQTLLKHTSTVKT